MNIRYPQDMATKAKNEIPHEELDKNEDKNSARYIKLGSKNVIKMNRDSGEIVDAPIVLIDKVIFPINKCPYCGSEVTFHKRIQENGDMGNVLKTANSFGSEGYTYIKYDYCLDCHKEFIIEVYIWKFEK